jgi:hypothetical protein
VLYALANNPECKTSTETGLAISSAEKSKKVTLLVLYSLPYSFITWLPYHLANNANEQMAGTILKNIRVLRVEIFVLEIFVLCENPPTSPLQNSQPHAMAV